MANVTFKNVVVEYNGVKTIEKQFEAKVESIGTEVKIMNNDNKTKYRTATISFIDATGKEQKSPATIYEKSIEKNAIVVGEKYATNARKEEDGIYLNVKPFPFGGNLPTEDMFGGWGDEIPSEANLAASKTVVQ